MDAPNQNKNSAPLLVKLNFYFQSFLAFMTEKKELILWSLTAFIIFLCGALFWINKASQTATINDIKATKLVSQLRSPILGEKQPQLPSYEEINTTLASSPSLEERYNGVLLEEAIVANKKDGAFSLFKKNSTLFPLQECPWKEMVSITETLESDQYEKAHILITSLLQEIQKKNKEPLLRELVGYLHLEEGYCLKKLAKPEGESSIQFENWKKSYPDLAKQLITIVDIEK